MTCYDCFGFDVTVTVPCAHETEALEHDRVCCSRITFSWLKEREVEGDMIRYGVCVCIKLDLLSCIVLIIINKRDTAQKAERKRKNEPKKNRDVGTY